MDELLAQHVVQALVTVQAPKRVADAGREIQATNQSVLSGCVFAFKDAKS